MFKKLGSLKNKKIIIILVLALVLQSFASVFTKLAGKFPTLSWQFLLFYCCSLGIVALFSILWQIILEKLPLTTAYMRKGVTYILILLWSVLIFGENITVCNIIGSVLIISGLVVNSNAD